MPSETLPLVNERSVASEQGIAVIEQENLIKRKVEALDKIKIEIKQTKEMYNDSFNNNPTFVEKRKASDAALVERKKIAYQIAKEPGVASLKQKLDDLNLSKREQEGSISHLLMDLTTKRPEMMQLELFDGRFASIVKTAKLTKPKKPKKRRFR